MYSAEPKLRAVQDYMAGKVSLRQICRQYIIKNNRHFLSMGGASKSALLISDYWLFILGGCSSCDGIGGAAGTKHDKLGRHSICALVG